MKFIGLHILRRQTALHCCYMAEMNYLRCEKLRQSKLSHPAELDFHTQTFTTLNILCILSNTRGCVINRFNREKHRTLRPNTHLMTVLQWAEEGEEKSHQKAPNVEDFQLQSSLKCYHISQVVHNHKRWQLHIQQQKHCLVWWAIAIGAMQKPVKNYSNFTYIDRTAVW